MKTFLICFNASHLICFAKTQSYTVFFRKKRVSNKEFVVAVTSELNPFLDVWYSIYRPFQLSGGYISVVSSGKSREEVGDTVHE